MDEQSPLPKNDEDARAQQSAFDELEGAHCPIDNEGASGTAARRGISWLVILVPLFLCLVTSALGAVIATPLRIQIRESNEPRLPVTGGDPHLAITPQATEAPGRAPDPVVGQSYREIAVDNLSTCMNSFHDFFIMEELASHQPDVIKSDTWQADVTQTMNAFRDDCQKLGSLPDAPPSFIELDHWLKLAAAEVGPATDGFSNAIQSQTSGDLRGSIRHMMRFVEYANNAEAILSGLEQRREI